MSKQTPFDLACAFLNHHTSCPKDLYDFDCDCETTCIDNYAECWKKYFQQQADIDDGYELADDIKGVINDLYLTSDKEPSWQYRDGWNNALTKISKFLDWLYGIDEKHCIEIKQQAGIEVE